MTNPQQLVRALMNSVRRRILCLGGGHGDAATENRPGTEDFAVLSPLRFVKGGHFLLVLAFFLADIAASNAQSAPHSDNGVLATLVRWSPLILKGFSVNLMMSIGAMTIGTVAGVCLGLAQISLFKPAHLFAYAVTQMFRNSPWLVMLFFISLALPFQIKIGDSVYIVPDWLKATLGFSLPVMANISEVVRGAIASIPSAQWDAARSLAFTRSQCLRMIILPQCIKRMIPPWMNWYAILTLATPLCYIMGVEEAVNYTNQAITAEGGRPELLAPFYLFVLVLFFLYIYPISRLATRLETKYAVHA
jgi:polar amino acid transport system permease protein